MIILRSGLHCLLRFYFWIWSVVLWLFFAITVCFCQHAFADEVLQHQGTAQYRWHARVGIQVAHELPDFRYVPVNRFKVSAWSEIPDLTMASFSFFSLQRELTDSSSIELSYVNDGSEGLVYGTQPVRIVFGYAHPVLRAPLEVDVRSLKLTCSRILWKPEPFRLGALISVQALQLSMNARLSPLLESWVGFDHLDYLVVVPSAGVFAEYRTRGALKYRVSSEYLTVPFRHIDGQLFEFNAGAEYRLSDRFFLGLGYRFSDRNVRLHQKRYDLNGSYVVHGYQLYTGFDF
jgi:hypothetical protein